MTEVSRIIILKEKLLLNVQNLNVFFGPRFIIFTCQALLKTNLYLLSSKKKQITLLKVLYHKQFFSTSDPNISKKEL